MSAPKSRRINRFQFAACSALVVIAAAAIPVASAARADPTVAAEASGPLAEKKRELYRKFVTTDTCSSVCTVKIGKIKKNTRLEIRHVTCAATGPTSSSGTFFQIAIHKGLALTAASNFPASPTATQGSTNFSFANAETFFFAKAGETLYAATSWDGTINNLQCTLTGELVTLK